MKSGRALIIVAGTGLTTYLAHCVAEQQEMHVLHGRRGQLSVLKHAFRNAVPILSSTAGPVAVLALGYWALLYWAPIRRGRLPGCSLPGGCSLTV